MLMKWATACECEPEYKAILQLFMSCTSRLQNSDSVPGITFLGRSRLCQLSNDHLVAVHYVAKQVSRETVVKYFDRIIVRGEVVHSNNYCRSLKRNSNTVILDDDSILSVEHFFKASL